MCLHLLHKQHIFNVPVDYLKKSMDGTPFHRQLLAFWMCIKMKYGDSLYRPSISGIMQDFGCGHSLAKRLLDFVTTNNRNLLFRYNPVTNGLVAQTWKSLPCVKNIRFSVGGKAKMKYCAKVHQPRYVSINNVIRALRQALIKVPIDEMQRSDKFLSKSVKYSSCSDRALALNQKKLGRMINAHRSTVSRLMKDMEIDGEVKILRHSLQQVYDIRNEKWLVDENTVQRFGLDKRHLIIVNDYGCVRDANEYIPKKRTSFNVIINAHNRINEGGVYTFRSRQVKNKPHDHADVFYY